MTEQLPDPLSVQLAGLNEPTALLDHVTVPVGVIAVPTSVSATVAVHRVGPLMTTVSGLQFTVVDVARVVAVTDAFPELEVWSVSPP